MAPRRRGVYDKLVWTFRTSAGVRVVALYTVPTFLENLEMPWNVRELLLLIHHPFNGLFSRTTWVSRYQKGKASHDLNETR